MNNSPSASAALPADVLLMIVRLSGFTVFDVVKLRLVCKRFKRVVEEHLSPHLPVGSSCFVGQTPSFIQRYREHVLVLRSTSQRLSDARSRIHDYDTKAKAAAREELYGTLKTMLFPVGYKIQ